MIFNVKTMFFLKSARIEKKTYFCKWLEDIILRSEFQFLLLKKSFVIILKYYYYNETNLCCFILKFYIYFWMTK